MENKSEQDIKGLIEELGYIVVCDTNVLLNIYRFSPEFSEFALKCMDTVKRAIILPSTVRMEYLKHYRSEFGAMQKKVKNASGETKSQIESARRKVHNTCETLELLHYPDIFELQEGLEEKFNELRKLLDDFFKDRTVLEFISNSWGNDDLVYKLVEEITQENQLMRPVTQEEIYRICEEGEKRYKAEPPIPPGFKDAKQKDGVRKYSDLILWKEVLTYSKETQKNVIIVTDDVKSDWWIDDKGVKKFHPVLTKEFLEETDNKILAYTSSDFYSEISKAYAVEQTDVIEIALRITDADYIKRIEEEVFDKVLDELSLSGDTYIETFSSHIGTEGIDELEVIEHEFIAAEQVERDQDHIVYCFRYNIEADATSFDYWGRDDDTKQIILSPGATHGFGGVIEVEVIREADLFLDFEADDGFESARIIRGNLKETKYEPYFEEEEPLEGAYDTCPDCDCQINFFNDGGNEFCIDCAPEH